MSSGNRRNFFAVILLYVCTMISRDDRAPESLRSRINIDGKTPIDLIAILFWGTCLRCFDSQEIERYSAHDI